MIDSVSKKELEKYKKVPKLLFRDTIYTETELGKYLTSITNHYDFRAISSLMNQFRNRSCSFFKVNTDLGEEYVYFADYFQLFTNRKLVEEEPVEYTVEELKANYEKVFDIELGDMKVVDVLTSKQPTFFKYEGKYFRSMTSIKNQSYDRKISKKDY